MTSVKVFIIRAAGTNCELETAAAFQKAGAQTDIFHINQWMNNKQLIHQYQIFAIPGGFSYGDDIGSGVVLANEMRANLMDEINRFVQDGKLIIGICNGFQVLVKAGLLPGINPGVTSDATLTNNDSAKYDDRWVHLKKYSNKCVFTSHLSRISAGLSADLPHETIYLPVAHGEGKFITKDKAILNTLVANDQVVFRYSDSKGNPTMRYPENPNGSPDGIAGICDPTGRIFGLMPHPERFQDVTNHPHWTGGQVREADGMFIFQNAVDYVRNSVR
ncbi:MAG: phosphoribosylformylglycinamidine synthase I [Planctomycetes bacterium]|nr:phosphoribosylformylglycinamidine synthase I [Planctomycetota bacterium]